MPEHPTPDHWWDALRPESFFSAVYRRGDESLDGWLEDRELDLPRRTEREAEGVLRLLRPSPSDVILDCPCGYARHSSFLAARGCRVVGIDRSLGFLLDPMAPPGLAADSRYPLLGCGDMRRIPLASGTVTIALNLVLSFGFFESDQDNLAVLQEFHRVLRPGGTLLVHTDINPLRVADQTYGDRALRHLPGGGRLHVAERYDPERRRLIGGWTVEEQDGRSRTATYNLRVYALDELAAMLHTAGFVEPIVLGGLDPDQGELEPTSQEVVWLARRAGPP